MSDFHEYTTKEQRREIIDAIQEEGLVIYHDDYTLKDPNGNHLMESDNFSHGRLEVGPDLNKRSVPRIPDGDDDATEELDMV